MISLWKASWPQKSYADSKGSVQSANLSLPHMYVLKLVFSHQGSHNCKTILVISLIYFSGKSAGNTLYTNTVDTAGVDVHCVKPL